MKVVIIGATHAGTLAAQEILKYHPETEITIYERYDNFSFYSCGISLYLDGEVNQLEDFVYATPGELREMGADVKDKHDVMQVDAKAKTVLVANMKTGDVFTDHYDKLVMATGSSIDMPAMFDIDRSQVLLCKNYQEAKEIYNASKNKKHIAIIGGGYAGTEFAESFAKIGHDVHLFQSHDRILNNYLDKDASDRATALLEEHGIHVHLNQKVTALIGNTDGSVTLRTPTDEFTLDIAITSTGFIPNTNLLKDQVTLSSNGALVINDHMQTSDPDIYAAGDCAIVRFNPTGQQDYTPLASNALRQGFLVAHNIFGDNYPYMGTQATSAIKLFDHCLATTGLTLDRALSKGLNAKKAVYEGTWRPTYMPTTDALTINLIYDQDSRRILGAQFWSKHEITQSANAVSIAIQNNNTIDDLALVDMLFQPNFDFPFNYLNLVAQNAVEQERQAGHKTPRFTALGYKADEENN
ncbi:FAD-dependent oxidoreductase [Agrilactobacillus yilanensis]|uniref:FAD-dependent oxidoreductase n=1 Tax=Agrilactobacillus yilanensis TaxID=2485997 RepID=A0ABW4J8G2_9LACO|nr:FAD-dependent oxidoreductase [Agrilactobacillus yilanensis]